MSHGHTSILYSTHTGDAGTEITEQSITLNNAWTNYRFLYIVTGNGLVIMESSYIPTHSLSLGNVIDLFFFMSSLEKHSKVEIVDSDTVKITLGTWTMLKIYGVL